MTVETIYARAVALRIADDRVEVEIQPVDLQGNGLGYRLKTPPESWESVKARYMIDDTYAVECERYFAEGKNVLILRPQHVRGPWEIPYGTAHY